MANNDPPPPSGDAAPSAPESQPASSSSAAAAAAPARVPGPPPSRADLAAAQRAKKDREAAAKLSDTGPLLGGPAADTEGSFEWWVNKLGGEVTNYNDKQEVREVLAAGIPASDDTKKALLRHLLYKGFIPFASQDIGAEESLKSALANETHLDLGFRGETRNADLVKQHDGCKRKVDVDFFQQKLNTNAAWHPFSDESCRKHVYFRRNNGDNCLHTAVSVAYDFDTASKFPLLTDLAKDAPQEFGRAIVVGKNLAVDGVKVRQLDPGLYPNVRLGAGEALYEVPSIRTSVYLFKLKSDRTYNTASLQKPSTKSEKDPRRQRGAPGSEFPERATDAIPWSDMLARVMVDRVHFGNDSNAGHMNLVAGWEMLHPNQTSGALLGGGTNGPLTKERIEEYLSGIAQAGKLNSDGTGGIRFTTSNTGTNCAINRVVEVHPTKGWGDPVAQGNSLVNLDRGKIFKPPPVK